MTKSNSIFISGGRVSERLLIEECTKWCIKRLLPRFRTIDLKIRVKEMEDMGCCYQLNDNSRQFKITIKKGLSLFDLISTICHEMVHLKQYARKELRWCNKTSNRMWKKSVYNDVSYDNQPWEREAYRLEKRLAIEFFTSTSTNC